MAHNVMRVDVVDSEEQIFSGEAEYLVAPAVEGEVGIYPNHIAMISRLKPGVLRLQVPGHTQQLVFAISGGFLEVQKNHATILADIVERTESLDIQRLNEQKTIAEAKIKRSDSNSTAELAKAHASLEIAIAQLKAVDYIKKHSNRS